MVSELLAMHAVSDGVACPIRFVRVTLTRKYCLSVQLPYDRRGPERAGERLQHPLLDRASLHIPNTRRRVRGRRGAGHPTVYRRLDGQTDARVPRRRQRPLRGAAGCG